MKGKFKNYSSIAGAQPKRIWVCNGCGVQHTAKVAQCSYCGRLDFTYFPSEAEAMRWAKLRRDEKVGVIKDLQRQVRYPLYAFGPDGQAVLVTHYQADFVYHDIETDIRVIEDEKPFDGMLPEAQLKLKWMAAQGAPVTTHRRR